MSIRLKAYKFRLLPNKTQQVLLSKTFGCTRYFWNQQVAIFNSYNKEINPKPVFKTSTELRSEIEWMKDVSAAAIQQKEIDFRQFKSQRFSKSRKKSIGDPKFKKKGNKDSYRLPNQKFKLIDDKIQLEKIGRVKFVKDREIPDGKLMSVTVSRNPSGQHFISVLIEQEILPLPKTNKEVGLDVGLKEFYTSSEGVTVGNPRYFRESQSKLKMLQMHLSNKKKGSSRREKLRLKVAKVYQKISNQRSWFLHNESTKLIKEFDVIVIEDLNVQGMLKNRKLSKSISDVSWSKFFNMLKYKADWYGKSTIKRDRFDPTSKRCSCCGWIKEDLKLSDREFECGGCGLSIDRDYNAALNIKRVGVNALYNQSQSGCDAGLPAIHVEAIKVS